VCGGFSISKCFKKEILTLRVLMQDGKQSDEQPCTAELCPDELTVPGENFKIGKMQKYLKFTYFK
jgi:hypothetical protein